MIVEWEGPFWYGRIFCLVRRIFGANLVCRLVRRHYRRNFESLTVKVLWIGPLLNKGELSAVRRFTANFRAKFFASHGKVSGENIFRLVRRTLRRKTFRLIRRSFGRKPSHCTANLRAKSFASYGEVSQGETS